MFYYLWLKFITVAERHAAASAVDAPTDPAIRLVEDVFEVDKQSASSAAAINGIAQARRQSLSAAISFFIARMKRFD